MKPTEFGNNIEPKWQVAGKLVKQVQEGVEQKFLTPLDGARPISAITARLYGYDEFILRESRRRRCSLGRRAGGSSRTTRRSKSGRVGLTQPLPPHGDRELFLMNADGSNRRRLTHFRGADGAEAWLPGGRIVFSHSRGDEALPHWYLIKFNGSGPALTPAAVRSRRPDRLAAVAEREEPRRH